MVPGGWLDVNLRLFNTGQSKTLHGSSHMCLVALWEYRQKERGFVATAFRQHILELLGGYEKPNTCGIDQAVAALFTFFAIGQSKTLQDSLYMCLMALWGYRPGG